MQIYRCDYCLISYLWSLTTKKCSTDDLTIPMFCQKFVLTRLFSYFKQFLQQKPTNMVRSTDRVKITNEAFLNYLLFRSEFSLSTIAASRQYITPIIKLFPMTRSL